MLYCMQVGNLENIYHFTIKQETNELQAKLLTKLLHNDSHVSISMHKVSVNFILLLYNRLTVSYNSSRKFIFSVALAFRVTLYGLSNGHW